MIFSSRFSRLLRLLVATLVRPLVRPFRSGSTLLGFATHTFLLTTIIFLLGGCGKSPDPQSALPPQQSANPPSINPPPTLRLHWLGKKHLSTDSNATNFVSIWNMPESQRLESQTLDKLSTAPWRLLTTSVPLSNAPTALLRPLLDDLVQEETYIEVVSGTNQPTETVLAIKLPPDRAALWQASLPIILKSILRDASETTTPAGDYQLSTKNHQLTFVFTNGWTLLSMADIKLQLSGSRLLPLVRARFTASGAPYEKTVTNAWVHGTLDFHWLKRIFDWRSVTDGSLPRAEFSISGEAGKLRSSAQFLFQSKPPFDLEPWNIPTNLVHDPLSGFMAVRGIRPLLESCGLWDGSKFGYTPNQATFWSQSGHPALRFFAFPSQQSSNQMDLLSKFLLDVVNPKMAVFPNTTNVPIGSFEPMLGSQRLRWRGIPYITPNLDVAQFGSQDFITGGLFSNRITNSAVPDSLLGQLKNNSDIILYDWENTQATAFPLIQISQTIRFVFGLNRFSMTNNAALPWIVAVSPKLEESGTTIRLTSTNTVSLTRSSTIGLTGLEIHLLADWFESPDFPQGTFTRIGKLSARDNP